MINWFAMSILANVYFLVCLFVARQVRARQRGIIAKLLTRIDALIHDALVMGDELRRYKGSWDNLETHRTLDARIAEMRVKHAIDAMIDSLNKGQK